jgi:8-oxo-dGTP pyrophosphatase MutT (NUDIX family)
MIYESDNMTDTQWLKWARLLQSWAQTGIAYTDNVYDKERYDAIINLVAEIVATHSDLDQTTVNGILAQESGPGTPKFDVRGVVFKNDAILMVREVSDNNRWTLPGGWADVNESPAESTVREVYEESGYETRAVKLLAMV